MILTQLDKDIQEIIIQKIHWLWLKQSREKELDLKWCIVIGYKNTECEKCYYTNSLMMDWDYIIFHPFNHEMYGRYDEKPIEFSSICPEHIIWLPPTLERVIYCLWFEYWVFGNYFCELKPNWFETICDWNLLNDDWTSATLRDQSELTKKTIYKLIK